MICVYSCEHLVVLLLFVVFGLVTGLCLWFGVVIDAARFCCLGVFWIAWRADVFVGYRRFGGRFICVFLDGLSCLCFFCSGF